MAAMAPKATAAELMDMEEAPLVLEVGLAEPDTEAEALIVVAGRPVVTAALADEAAAAVPVAAAADVAEEARAKYYVRFMPENNSRILTNGARSTVTNERKDTRVGPGVGGRLANTDPVATRNEIIQRIDLERGMILELKFFEAIILSYIISTSATVNGCRRVSDLSDNAKKK